MDLRIAIILVSHLLRLFLPIPDVDPSEIEIFQDSRVGERLEPFSTNIAAFRQNQSSQVILARMCCKMTCITILQLPRHNDAKGCPHV